MAPCAPELATRRASSTATLGNRCGLSTSRCSNTTRKTSGGLPAIIPSLAPRTNTSRCSRAVSYTHLYPLYFDALYCNLVAAGEQAGILDTLLERLATYKEKILAIKSKIKSALFYPISVIVVAFVITAVIMIFVIPAFKDVFKSFGADLPAFTAFVFGISDLMVQWWWAIVLTTVAAFAAFIFFYKRSTQMQYMMDRLLLKLPVIGNVLHNSAIARFSRTLAVTFKAGVPLVEAMDNVAGATRNRVYTNAVMLSLIHI